MLIPRRYINGRVVLSGAARWLRHSGAATYLPPCDAALPLSQRAAFRGCAPRCIHTVSFSDPPAPQARAAAVGALRERATASELPGEHTSSALPPRVADVGCPARAQALGLQHRARRALRRAEAPL